MRLAPLTALAAMALLPLAGCSPSDIGGDTLNVLSVKFSEASPAVDDPGVAYSGSVLDAPSLDKFKLKLIFHVKADNSANQGKARFGSSAVKPVVAFRVNSKTATPFTTTLEPFIIDPNTVANLDFPVEIPLAAIDKAVARKIVNGDPIPYFLSGTLKFDLLRGSGNGSGVAELDLASGEIATRPSASVKALLVGLL